jgi:hypothetical protein
MKTTGRKRALKQDQARLPGEIRYRPATGKASDRLLNQLKANPALRGDVYRPPKTAER